jgi:hypothetical protein
MNTMTLEKFMCKFKDKTDYVVEKDGYSLHMTFFEKDYVLLDDDLDYFKSRIETWKEHYFDEGSEPFFWPDKMEVAGVVRYGAITN